MVATSMDAPARARRGAFVYVRSGAMVTTRISRGRRAWLVPCVVALAAIACASGGGSHALDCATDADCVAKGGDFVGAVCSDQHQCVAPMPCTTNQACIDAHAGAPWICRKRDNRCASLLSTDCTTLLAQPSDVANDDTVWFGILFPLIGEDRSGSLPDLNGVDLARRDFNTTTNGLPALVPGRPPRPFAFVTCDDSADSVRAATHLTDDVGVPAIIGPSYSGDLITVATEVTIPKKVLVISSSATSPFITNLPNKNGLVWRTCPSDVEQSVALSLVLSTYVEPSLRATGGPLTGDAPLRLAVVHKGDAYGQGLSDGLFQQLLFNGKSAADNGTNFRSFNYGDPRAADAEAQFQTTVQGLVDFRPHVVVLVSTVEGTTKVLDPLETAWPPGVARPHYMLSDGNQVPELIAAATGNDDLRRRVIGTIPGSTGPLYQAYAAHYLATFSDGTTPTSFSGNAYDAAFLLAYATVAVGARPLTGPALSRGLTRLVPPGVAINAGSQSIGDAFEVLQTGQNADYAGTSGPLDFDITTGEALADIQVWCIAGGAAPAFVTSGAFYSATTKALEGTLKCP
jgi:branched-chain amino acid transport system substrate-binding protein